MFAISPTDNLWFQNLKNNNLNNYINFWTPSPWNISRLSKGDKLYFMLKSPVRKIGGFGEFTEYKNMSVFQAWEEFGYRNGVLSRNELIERINIYKAKNNVTNNEIGCIILNNCQYWENEEYKDTFNYNIDFSPSIVKIKYFDSLDPFEKAEITNNLIISTQNFNLIKDRKEDYVIKAQTNIRKGQSKFKSLISKAYNNKCCISNEQCPELLEAAHIQAYINEKSNHIQNGLLLRIDLHRLFDNDLLFIDEQYFVHISSKLSSKDYQQYNGLKIKLPKNENEYPSKEVLYLRRESFRE